MVDIQAFSVDALKEQFFFQVCHNSFKYITNIFLLVEIYWHISFVQQMFNSYIYLMNTIIYISEFNKIRHTFESIVANNGTSHLLRELVYY